MQPISNDYSRGLSVPSGFDTVPVGGAAPAGSAPVLDAGGNLRIGSGTVPQSGSTAIAGQPEVEPSRGSVAGVDVERLGGKLADGFANFSATYRSVKAAVADGASESSSGTQKMLFDIYSLMNLMLEIAAEQRESARTERYAELQRQVADIQSKAEMMRTSALSGLVMSVCFSVASIAGQMVAAGISTGAQSTADRVEANSGIDRARSDFKLLSAADANETNSNLRAVESRIGDTVTAKAQGLFSESNEARATLDQALQGGVGDDIANAKRDYAQKLDSDQGKLETTLADKRRELIRLESNNGSADEIQQTKAEIEELEGMRDWGKAHIVNEKMQYGLNDSLAADIAAAEHVFDQRTALLKGDAHYKAANARAEGSRAWSTIMQQSGQALTQIVSCITGMQDAAATEYDASQKSDEQAMQESDDLASSAQSLADSVLDLLRAVLSAENQSINQITA